MDNEKLVEAVVAEMVATGLYNRPMPSTYVLARCAVRVVRAAVIEECADIVEELTMQSGMCDGVTASKRIRATKETKP